jgi:hypothetical protein
LPVKPKRTLARTAKRQERKSIRASARLRPASKSPSALTAGRTVFPIFLPNEQDNAVIRRLSTAGLGDLPVDQFSRFLGKGSRRDDPRSIVKLRFALIQVYFVAARARDRARAAQWQIELAQQAFASLKAAVTGLGEVRPKRQRGIAGLIAKPLDDIKGSDELNQFSSKCWKIQLDLVPIAQVLDDLITAETAKSKAGQRGEPPGYQNRHNRSYPPAGAKPMFDRV